MRAAAAAGLALLLAAAGGPPTGPWGTAGRGEPIAEFVSPEAGDPVAIPESLAATSGLAAPREIASYRIDARLDADAHTISGSERVRFTNATKRATSTVCMHLYLNGFRNTDSTFFRESKGKHRRWDILDEEDPWGWIDVASIATGGAAIRFTAAGTLGYAVLPTPLVPGASVDLDVEFTSRLPRVFARTGWADTDHGRFFMVGQWFPKVGVLTDDGWTCDDFHAATEFFADFGRYDVTLDVPEGFVVGATGLPAGVVAPGPAPAPAPAPAAGRTVHRFHAEKVHDFAWTAWPGYETRTLAGPNGVEIVLLHPPEHASWADRHLDVAARAMAEFGGRLGRYPYPRLTIVDPPFEAGGAGGMEYPTLITVWTDRWLPAGAAGAALAVTIHELGHQWFYGVLATNEPREAHLDEGLNTYVTGKVADALWGSTRSLFDLGFARMGYFDVVRLRLERPLLDPVIQDAWRFRASGDYGAAVYGRTTVAMRTLEAVIGEDTVTRGLRLYAARHSWTHPTTADLVRALSDTAGRDVGWYFDEVLRRPGDLDYAVGAVRSDPRPKPRGRFLPGEDGAGTATVAVTFDEAGEVEPPIWETEVDVERRGTIVLPVPVRFVFEDGTEVRAVWSREDQLGTPRAWTRFTFTTETPLVLAEVDPDRALLLDRDRLDDGRRLDSSGALAIARHASAATVWIQTLLQAVGF